ncbi:MAG: MBOAT family O-acyltransferase [Lachnospira sp.]
MVFSSFEFLLWFLPFFLAIYYLTPKRYRNMCLFIFSLIFYAYGTLEQPYYILLILISITVNYIIGRLIDSCRKQRKLYLILGISYNFLILAIFKYADFFIKNINKFLNITGNDIELPLANLLLPIGISFYTFQIVSYLIDVYRKKAPAETNIINLGTYIMMFPQLIAGPIVKFSDIKNKLHKRFYSRKEFFDGIKIFIIGLGLKILLANRIGSLWQDVNSIGFESISTPLAWMGIVAFSFQIYFDFWGYSLMAVGLGKMIGFTLPLNFNNPYTACTMTDFWRRWHITLGTWFKEYVYIPLGGNRNGKLKTIRNLLIVWLLTGFWHGADWNFILWGLLIFIIISLEKTGLGKFLNNNPIIGHLYMLLLIPLSWLIFAVSDLSSLVIYYKRLIGIGEASFYSGDFIKYWQTYGILLVAGLLFSTTIPQKIYRKIKDSVLIIPVLAIIIAASIYCLYRGLNDPFLYFRF